MVLFYQRIGKREGSDECSVRLVGAIEKLRQIISGLA